ncbi:hypothetical protein [Pedobacter caeni]|uniref:Lipoprotein n=1 Tax=Pedobacter caeni TaxID=288992 RepID=A0A1M5F7A1_9SPHI|nr:hypothetical protein [Pedobacter caeni]SHF86931.1 hypothetical protein SAMN04488522_103949 [Pedobacter caeni]
MKNLSMKHHLVVLLAVLNLLVFQSCQSQTPKNPQHLGEGTGDFDLDQLTFKEDVNALFSKVNYIKLPHKDAFYDKVKKEEVIRDTLAFEYKVSKADRAKVNTYFLDKSLNHRMVFFFVDKKNQFKAFSFFASKKDGDFSKQIELIDKKYKKYKVNLKPDKRRDFADAKAYQWESPDKIISVTMSTKPADGEYTMGLTVVDKKTDFKKFPINQFIYGNSVCLDNTCKE